MEPIEKRHNSEWKTKKRVRRRKILLVALLAIYALMGWLRLEAALTYQEYFRHINLQPGPIYLAITGGILGFTFSAAILLILFNIRFARRFTRWLAMLFLIWFWIDRIWLSTRDAFLNRLEISFLITLVTFFWAFILIRKKDFQPPQNGEKENDGEQTGTGSEILPE